MIVGTAGHVDHGKTSLVRALTGVDTDRLVEEKARGITIELGFAYAPLAGADGTDGTDGGEPVGFVDVPGHRRFVQTMIAGAAGVDVGLLVVAADDGPMPQTREHLDILRWLGVDRLVVALTKIDRADRPGVDASTDAVAALLDDTPYRGSPIVPVSAVSGAGLDTLTATLLAQDAARHGEARQGSRRGGAADDGRAFRLAIDRAFVLQGIGLVVTGTCVAGSVAIDDTLTLLPGGREARVRGIHAQNRRVERAHAGQRVALNVVGRGIEKSVVHRGHWIVAPSIAFETQRIDVALSAAVGAADPERRAPFDARAWRTVRFHAGAAACNARVVLLDASGTEPAIAQIALDEPMHVVAGDRFVLRGTDHAATNDATASVAGGIVLDVDVPTRGRRSDERLRFLAVAAVGDANATLAAALDGSVRGIDLARWNATHNSTHDTNRGPAAVTAHAVQSGDGPSSTPRLFAPARWDAMRQRIVDVLAAEHARVPDAVGPGRDRLRRMASPGFDAATFGALVDTLKADGRIAQTGAWLHLPAHRVELSDDDRRRFSRASPLLDDATQSPPRVRDVARALGDDEAAIRALFARLASRGELYRVAHDHYFLPATIRRLAAAVADVAAADGFARAAPFRDRIVIGRKVAIQLLEFFDRVGYTRRIGDTHRIVQPTLFDA